MNGKESQAARAALALIASAAFLLSGCAGLQRVIGNRQYATPPPAQPAAPAETLTQQDRAALDRVAQYLERTEAYDLRTLARDPLAAPLSAIASSLLPGSPFYRADRLLTAPATLAPGARAAFTDPHALHSADGAFANTQVTLANSAPSEPVPALPVVQTVSIRTAEGVELPAEKPVRTSATNESLSAVPPRDTMSLDGFVRHLERKTAEGGGFDAQWQLKLLQLALNRDTEAAQISSNLSPTTRRILSAMAAAVVAARTAARNPMLVPQDVVERVEQLRSVLAEQADPVVSKVSLCRRVVGFGVYEEMDSEAFPTGQTLQTIVYCELSNFRSYETDDGRFRTALGTRLEVLSEQGQSMWQHEEREIVDLCRRRRKDFFLAQRITIPPTLPAGAYVLKVFVEDKLSARADEATHHFSIGAPTSLTAGR